MRLDDVGMRVLICGKPGACGRGSFCVHTLMKILRL